MAKLVRKGKATAPDFLPDTLRIAELAAQHKAKDIKAYDLRGLTVMADVFIICSASSEAQVKAIYGSIREGMKEIGVRPRGAEGTPAVGWLLIDFGNIVVHVFREEARQFYDLDGLWGDAPSIDLQLDA
ncbi:MAG: ribosome silencing factor [Candidatus Hydrogenedentales bacterium]